MRRLDSGGAPRKIAKTHRRTIVRRVVVAILFLVAVDTAAWAMVCRQLERGVHDQAAAALEAGWSMSAETLHWGGWPFAAEIDLGAVAASANAPAGLIWRAERVRVRLAVRHPATLMIPVEGAQSIAAEGVAAIPIAAARTVIRADLTGSTAVQASFRDLQMTLTAGKLTLAKADISLPPNAINAAIEGVALPGVATPINSIRLAARIDPAVPVAVTAEASGRAWRQAGGRIDITDAAVRWDALDATGHGTIGLDDQLQPQGLGTVKASGLPRLLDDLVQAGALASAQAVAAKAVIAVLGAPSGGDRIQLPISLEDGVLRIARFPLLRFPPLAWE